MGRHAGSPKWAPSDRGLAVIQAWRFGTLVLAAMSVVIALIALVAGAASGPRITQAPLARAMQGLTIASANATIALGQLHGQLEQLDRKREDQAFNAHPTDSYLICCEGSPRTCRVWPSVWPSPSGARVGRGEPPVNRCLEGRFTQRVNLHLPKSEAVWVARG